MNESHFKSLLSIVGPEGLLRPSDDLSRYELGAREGRGRAACVVRPASAQQVSSVVAYCARSGVDLVAQGGNTGLVGASTPDETGRQGVLSFDRLSSEIEIDPGNRSVTVSAGVLLSTLNERLAQHGLFFPIDLGADPSIGGMVAANTGGARFVRYGDVRDHVLGLEVVLPDRDGTILDLLGDLRKSNLGLDSKQLFIGTEGENGFITKVVLEVHRLPQQTAAAILVPRDDAAVIELLEAFEEHAGNDLAAFEGMSGNAIRKALAHVPNLKSPFGTNEVPPFSILVELARTAPRRPEEASLEETLTGILADIWERQGAPLANALVGRSDDFWAVRHALTEGLKASGRVIAFDVSCSRTNIMALRRDLEAGLSQTHPSLQICDFGHIGDGGVHFNLVEPRDGGATMDNAQIHALRTTVFDKVVKGFRGSFSAEHGVGRINREFYERYVGDVERRLASGVGDLVRGTGEQADQGQEGVGALTTNGVEQTQGGSVIWR